MNFVVTRLFPGYNQYLKAEKGQSKENLGINIRTTGLPKARNGQGNRGIVVPSQVIK